MKNGDTRHVKNMTGVLFRWFVNKQRWWVLLLVFLMGWVCYELYSILVGCRELPGSRWS